MSSAFEEYSEFIPDFEQFSESLYHPFPAHLRINRLKTDTAALISRLREKGLSLERSSEKDNSLYLAEGLTSPGNLLEYFTGEVHPQALTSCLAASALFPKRDALVLDMCASPGGKTSHLAQLMENTGTIVANELYAGRQASLGHTLSRLGVTNTIVSEYQAQEFPLKNKFDYILADVPCSGEGMFRIDKASAQYETRNTKQRLPDLQKKILLRGFDLLKEKGILLYSTCTYNPEENESVIHHLLENRDAVVYPIDIGFKYESGLSRWRDNKYDPQLRRSARFYPHRINSVGFFMARIGKRG